MVATTFGSEYYNTNKSSRSIRNFDVVHRCSHIIKWKGPCAPWLKINFDDSVVGSQAAAGFVIKDHNGSSIVAGTCNLGENTISVAEALALRDTLKFAKVKGFKDICVEGDSKLVINSILNKCRTPRLLKTIIENIRLLARSFSFIFFRLMSFARQIFLLMLLLA
ncbi:hypothetical protein DVH24_032705 [Malus domestica]|uniref:RNase H type-1 domain-containing protein n=1 Tax=Malus domestica TaxID=3750 RepID=A0A498J426_MALDO|nr:hypothetical protein DVH24_032705 [Malus domestica]